MDPPSKLAMEFGPRGRKSNDSTVNMSKSKDFGPPYRCRLGPTDLAPPTENTTLKHSKGRGLKKVRNFWEMDEHFWGMLTFFGKRLKKEKGRSKMSAKIWPPPPFLKFWIRYSERNRFAAMRFIR